MVDALHAILGGNQTTLKSIASKLQIEYGVQDPEDLKEIVEGDLPDLGLTKIQFRKWQKYFKSNKKFFCVFNDAMF